MKRIFLAFILISQLFAVAWAESFVVKNIQIDGLQRISPATVENYLPIKRGQTMQPSRSSSILRSLYKTGFFKQITLSRDGNTLVIHVQERPTIGQLNITGNSVIPTDKLKSVMDSLGVVEGRVYDPELLVKIKQGLLNQYYQLGRFNARVEIKETSMTRNREKVDIIISEGLVARVQRITIIGNHVFDESTLVRQMDLSTTGMVSYVMQTDRYSDEKLEASLDKLRGYYLDHGYLRFQVKSSQAQMTPDRKSVYITIAVSEGKPYTIKGYKLSGNLIYPRSLYESYIKVVPGELFSREKIMASEKSVSKMLGERGYMFSSVSLQPDVNDKERTVLLVFNINPGKRTYVRHITFSDNNRTNDAVLRREVLQWESAPASTAKLEESKQHLSLLPFIRDVNMTVKPVGTGNDQVDVNYRVKEDNSASATFKVGYSQIYGVIFGAGLNQKNFFGTGNTLGLNLSRSQYEQFYGVDYTNPYYTQDGISRSIHMSASRVTPGNVTSLNNGYAIDEYNLGVLYGVPVGQERGVINRISGGASYQDLIVNLYPTRASNQILSFINNHGSHFQEADFKLGYSRDSRDKAIFPTMGAFNTLFADFFAPLAKSSLGFYMLNYNGRYYLPLSDQFILNSRADLAYGNGYSGVEEYPFFKNYYAGGIDSVRGYLGYNLGPRDSNYQAFGGNMRADASVGMIFPNFVSDNVRTNLFVDAGNVYTSLNNRSFGGQSTMSGPIRFSVGLEVDILTPFGPVELSLAEPIRARAHDKIERPQFALGANF